AAIAPRQIEQHAQLDGARVLYLVDEEVREAHRLVVRVDERTAQDLPDAEQERRVLGVDRRDLPVALPFAPHARVADAPRVHLIELSGAESGLSRERLGEALAAREELVPGREDSARFGPQLVPEALERAAGHLRERRGRPRVVERALSG